MHIAEFPSIDLVATNPWRPVDWRYRRANGILNGEIRTNRASEDRLVWRIVQFLRRYRPLEADREQIAAREALVRRNYPIYWVVRLLRMGSVCSEIEAWLLSGVPAATVAKQMGHPVELIEAFKLIAFDIDGRRENRSFVLNFIIGDAIHRELKFDQFSTIWKFYGYMYGPVMLEALVTETVNPIRPMSVEEVAGALRGDARGNMLRKHALATRLVPINSFTTAEISEGFHRELELERKNESAGGDTQSAIVTSAFKALLECLPVDVGPREQRQPRVDSKTLETYDQKAYELPTPALVAAVHDELSPELADLQDLEYPEPTNARIALDPEPESDE